MVSKQIAPGEATVTIVDIARTCNVSPASVSRVLTGLRGVKAEKREKILRAAESLGYRPNRMARRLVTKKSHLFGFIASDLRNTAYLEYFYTLERAVRQEGYEFLIADSERSAERESANIEKMLDNRVDGLMLLPVSDWIGDADVAHLRQLESTRMPIVLFGHLDGFEFDSISADEAGASALLIDHLYDLGHRTFAYVGIADPWNRPARERLNGVEEAITKKGLATSSLRVGCCESPDWPREVLKWLTGSEPPTAIICVNDLVAYRLYRPLREAGFAVPRDVSLCGFGKSLIEDTDIGELVLPSLTVVEFDNRAVATGGAAMLLDRLADAGSARKTSRVPTRILARESTGPVR